MIANTWGKTVIKLLSYLLIVPFLNLCLCLQR